MTLEANPADLGKFAQRTDELSGQCRKAADHVDGWLSIDDSDAGVIFAPIVSQVAEIREMLVTNADSMRRLTEVSAENLRIIAQNYSDQDSANAGQLGTAGGSLHG
ncbi:MAG: hypothetical protein GX542_02150 [Rhodococcus sp.]|nr:hypothetical protein [Rhodococcus sp. (in: high G+C Gram-positive bacteria)]